MSRYALYKEYLFAPRGGHGWSRSWIASYSKPNRQVIKWTLMNDLAHTRSSGSRTILDAEMGEKETNMLLPSSSSASHPYLAFSADLAPYIGTGVRPHPLIRLAYSP